MTASEGRGSLDARHRQSIGMCRAGGFGGDRRAERSLTKVNSANARLYQRGCGGEVRHTEASDAIIVFLTFSPARAVTKCRRRASRAIRAGFGHILRTPQFC
jgi:hypothetical protein